MYDRDLILAGNLRLPLAEAVAQKYAFLGRSSSGKSYAAGKLVELLLEAEAQVVVVDPVGIWWGLRLAANGKDRGLPVPIFGGSHGDVPLEATGGSLMADLVVNRNISAVLDVSEFSGGEQHRFVADFATSMLDLKKKQRSPVLLVWEESQEFVPEKSFKSTAVMVGAMTRLIKIGRNFGVGTALISQRPQAVSKEVLNQTEALFVFQLTGPQERKTVKGWIVEHGLDMTETVDALPSLKQGDFYVWSPQWLEIFQQSRVRAKKTFDASSTPRLDFKHKKAVQLKPIELEQIRDAMAATIQKAKDNDPRLLHQKIGELKRQIEKAEYREKRKGQAPAETKTVEKVVEKVVRVEVPVLANGKLTQATKLIERMHGMAERLTTAANAVQADLRRFTTLPPPKLTPKPAAPPPKLERPPRVRPFQEEVASTGEMPKGEVRVLSLLIQYPAGLTRSQISVLTGYSTSTRNTYLFKLQGKGYCAGKDKIAVTQAGIDALPGAEPLPSGSELQQYWLGKLPQGEARILKVLIEHYPHEMSREELSEATGYSVSTRNTYLHKLKAKQVIEVTADSNIVASSSLFD